MDCNTVESVSLIYLYPQFPIMRKRKIILGGLESIRYSSECLTKTLVPVPVVSFRFVCAFISVYRYTSEDIMK